VAFLGVGVNLLSFTKAKRAQNVNDYESWISGGVAPTLNAMDNNGEAYATVLIIDGTRVDDVRVYEDGIVPTVISRYGTGGGNVPMIFSHTQGLDVQASETNSPTLRTGGSGMAVAFDPYNHAVSETNQTLRTGLDLDKMGTIFEAPSVVRRLTPVECERLQGFPDDWTSGQADSNRYKQMGNAVAVPVVEWIISRMVANE
jgi:DNA (cytosine-5)-methyltransferase 1